MPRLASSLPLPAPVLGAAALAGVLAAVVAGCGDDDNGQSAATTAARTTTGEVRQSLRGGATTAPATPTVSTTLTTSTTPGAVAGTAAAPSTTTPTTAQLPGQEVTPQTPGGDGADGSTGSESSAGIRRPFNETSPWNTRSDDLGVDANSARYIRLVQRRLGVVEGQNLDVVRTQPRTITDPLFINTRIWTTPVLDSADGGVPTKVVCRQINLPPPNNDCGDGPFVEELSIPRDPAPFPQYDGWLTVLDRSRGYAYDLWRARRARDGQSMSYQFLRRWDLNGTGFLPPTFVSARGSGLPLFAGLILPEEIKAGRIDHALAIALPGPAARKYVQPASVTDGNGDFNSLPEGARVRLKRSIDINSLLRTKNPETDTTGRRRRVFPGGTNQRAARAILTALQRYGAIVVDRAGVPTLFARQNYDWTQPLRSGDGFYLREDGRTRIPRAAARDPRVRVPLLRGSEVQTVRVTDFEVIELPPIRNDPPLEGTLSNLTTALGQAQPQAVATTPNDVTEQAPRPPSTTTGTTSTTPTTPSPEAPALTTPTRGTSR